MLLSDSTILLCYGGVISQSLEEWEECRWTEVEVIYLLYKRKACKILQENSSNLFSEPLSLHFDFVFRKWNAKIWGQSNTCQHFIETLSEDNILFHIVFITLMIASYITTSFPVPVLLQCPSTISFCLQSARCRYCSFKD